MATLDDFIRMGCVLDQGSKSISFHKKPSSSDFGFATLVLNVLLAYSTGAVMWAAASTNRGTRISLSTWLAMSPATDYWGMLHLLTWKRCKNGRNLHIQWILVR